MRDPAVILHDGKRIAGNNFFDHVHVRKNSAQRGCKYCNAAMAFREVSFADEGANDAVSYGVHEGFEKGRVYTIQECSGDLDERRALGHDLSDSLRGDAAALERRLCGCGGFGSDSHE